MSRESPGFIRGECQGKNKLFVEENGFWWDADFIQAVVPQEELEAIELKDLEAILFGGVV